jgi:phosphomannomutase
MLCVHGDRPNAADFARRLRQALQAAGVEVRGLGVAADATPASRAASDRGAGA